MPAVEVHVPSQAAELAPATLNVPAGHCAVHALPRPVTVLYVPAPQGVQFAVEAPPVLYEPVGHASVHSDVRPVAVLYVPAPQGVQVEAPPMLNVPAAHDAAWGA